MSEAARDRRTSQIEVPDGHYSKSTTQTTLHNVKVNPGESRASLVDDHGLWQGSCRRLTNALLGLAGLTFSRRPQKRFAERETAGSASPVVTSIAADAGGERRE